MHDQHSNPQPAISTTRMVTIWVFSTLAWFAIFTVVLA